MKYYPAFLDLRGRRSVVIGGGTVAERKVLTLVRAHADVTVVSPLLTKRLLREKEKGRIRHIGRTYRKGDLKGAFLVIAATGSSETNARVAEDAPALVNVVDVPFLCNFIAPSLVERGDLVIAISTGGASPAFAKTLRKEIEKTYGNEIATYLSFLGSVRKTAMAAVKDKKKRERFLKGLAADRMLSALRSRGVEEMREQVRKRLDTLRS